MFHGIGKYIYSDISPQHEKEYNGGWSNNKFHGSGTLISKNGNRYHGKFIDDEFHGYGTYTWADGD